MQDAQARFSLRAPDFTFVATVELPKSSEIRDMDRLVGLFMWLLRDLDEVIRTHGQSDGAEAHIETLNYSLMLMMLRDNLVIRLSQSDRSEASEDAAQQMMMDMMRAAIPVIRPKKIVWQDSETAMSVDEFLSASGKVAPKRPHLRLVQQRRARPSKEYRFEYHGTLPALQKDYVTSPAARVTPRKVGNELARANSTAPKTPRPPSAVDALPVIVSQEDVSIRDTRFDGLRGAGDVSADAFNMFERESLPRRMTSWALTGVTAWTFLPAGAAMAVLNLTKGTNLRLNALAMTLSVSAVTLYASGHPTQAASYLDPYLRAGATQAWTALMALLA